MADPMYVPILKGKEGELAALEALYPNVREQVTPLIELPSVAYDYVNDRPAKQLDEHVAGMAERLRKAWGSGREVYIDLPWFGDDERLADGTVAVEFVLAECVSAGVTALPVVSRDRSAEYLAAVWRYVNDTKATACIRLRLDDFAEEIDLDAELAKLLRVSASDVDLIVDLGDLGRDDRDLLVARYVLGAVPRADEWRRMIVAASSFPEDLSEVDAATTTTLPRREWLLWTALQRKPKQLPRAGLIYGDYAIAHPVPREIDPRLMRMSASIRYTTENSWLVVKGRNVRQFGFEQYFDLARLLAERPEYSGPGFSWGDAYIAQCAAGTSGPGNATTWRKVGTNHHLTFVVNQLASPLVL